MGKKTKGILELKLNEQAVEFFTDEDNIIIPTLDAFIYSYSNTYGTIAYIKEKYFHPILEHIKRVDANSIKLIQIYGNLLIGFKVKTPQQKFEKTFYLLKYKIGTDELDIDKSLKLLADAPMHYLSGYTSSLRKEIVIEEEQLDLTIKMEPSLSPMIYAKTHKEFINAKCFDITSFYPYLLTQELPHFDKIINKEEMDLNNKDLTYYGGIKISKIKAKTAFLPLSLVGSNNDTEIKSGQGINIAHMGTRLISADEVVLFGFIPFLLDSLKEYEFESYEISSKIACFLLKKDEGLRSLVLKKFSIKQEKKRAGLDYLGEKILLNRLYGFFITKGNRTAAHYSQYIVQKGKNILLNIIKEIGLKDVVHSHTDSIKFVGEHEDVINAYNEKIEFEELGRFVPEGVMEKVIYYGTNKAKYIMNGELNFKHGGIEARDIEPLMKMDYNSIDKHTKYQLTISYEYTSEKGFVAITIEKEFGGSLK